MNSFGSETRLKPSRKWYVLGALFVVLPPAVFVFLFLSFFASLTDRAHVFEAPGQITVTVDDPGEFTIWRQTTGVVDGVPHSSTGPLPDDLQIAVSRVGSGEPLLITLSNSTQADMGGTIRESIGHVTLPTRGEYQIVVSGQFEPGTYIAFSESVVSAVQEFLMGTAMLNVIGALLILAGLTIFLLVFVLRVRAANRLREAEIRDLGLDH